MNRKILIAAALGLGLALTGAAMAQQGGFQCPMGGAGGGPGGYMSGGHMMMKGHGGPMGGGFGPERMCQDHDARVAGMLAFAEKKLAITDAQRDAWSAVATAIKAGGPALEKACAAVKNTDPNAKLTLPQRLERMQAFATIRTEQMSKVLPAVTALYDKLSPEQKATADGFFAHGGMGFGGMRGMRG